MGVRSTSTRVSDADSLSRPWWLHVALAIPLLLVPPLCFAASLSERIEQPTVDVRPIAPGDRLELPYWPFATHDGAGTPTLARVDIDAQVTPAGCGPFTWSIHPVPASKAQGLFCVGVIEGVATPALVVGEPGRRPYILVPGDVLIVEDVDGARSVQIAQPVTPLPVVVEAIRRWAAAPEGRR